MNRQERVGQMFQTQFKQQAMMIKAAFEEGWKKFHNYYDHLIDDEGLPSHTTYRETCWNNSTAKQIYDSLMLEAKGSMNVSTKG